MGKYVTIGQLRTQIQTSFASLKTYMDEKIKAPILSTAQQAKTLADSVVARADAGEFKGEKGDTGATGAKGDKGDKGDTGSPVTITMNGTTHTESGGDINLGTVITEHQSLSAYRTSAAQDTIDSGKVDKDGDKVLTDINYSASEQTKVNESYLNKHSHSNKALLDNYNPDSSTSAMTQSVGVDSSGKFWTAPGGGGTWGDITGTLSDQTDLSTALDGKLNAANPVATGSFSLGREAETTVGTNSVATGYNVQASGDYSHAEGWSSIAPGTASHAEGETTYASGAASHAEGGYTTASGRYSHAEGDTTTASGARSHAEGTSTKASSDCQHVQGKYNVEDTAGTYADIVGWGTSSSARKNISALKTDGELRLAGNVYVGCNDDSTGGAKLSKHSTVTATLSSSLWSSKVQTVNVTGVTASNTVIVSPAPASVEAWAAAKIYCSAQGVGTLTFTCIGDVPTSNLTANVVVME